MADEFDPEAIFAEEMAADGFDPEAILAEEMQAQQPAPSKWERVKAEAKQAYTPRGVVKRMFPVASTAAEEMAAWGRTLGVPGSDKAYELSLIHI